LNRRRSQALDLLFSFLLPTQQTERLSARGATFGAEQARWEEALMLSEESERFGAIASRNGARRFGQ
jgi:hypothetical protein